jgi:multidrug efflux pump subunit AcrA (membrane-fusion protein)
MGIGIARRRITVTLVVVALVGGLAGTVALRVSKRAAAQALTKGAASVALEFAATDLAYVESTPLARWLPVSGTLEPVHQAVVKAKVAGDIVGLAVREGEPVRAGQRIAHIESPDLESGSSIASARSKAPARNWRSPRRHAQ